MLTIIDYGIGNLGSVANMLKKIGTSPVISSDPKAIEDSTKLILGGVGAFDDGITKLNQLGLTDILNKKVLLEKTPILGICLGMQLFTKKSEEGKLDGLGWIDAETIRFQPVNNLKIPHMGWNLCKITNKKSHLMTGFHEPPRFYFVHSYHVKLARQSEELTVTTHGYEFCSSFESENIMGVQFHPEKSHRFGMQLLNNFVNNY